jgi:hypothetical protein
VLAAASISFALLATSVGLYVNKKSKLALQEMTTRVSTQSEIKPNASEENYRASDEPSKDKRQGAKTAIDDATDTDKLSKTEATLAFDAARQKSTASATDAAGTRIANNETPATAPSSSEENSGKSNDSSNPVLASQSEATETVADNNALIASDPLMKDLSNNGVLVSGKYSDRELPHLYSPKPSVITLVKPEVDPVRVMLARLALEESMLAQADKKEKETKSEKIWTSVGFAAGGFNSINHSVATPPAPTASLTYYAAAATTNAADKQAKASGVAYSMGLSFGAKLSRRWILQSGINYLTQSSDYVATNVVADNNYQTLKAESINSLGKIPLLADASSSDQRLAPTAPYSVNNNVKFFSVPVQAGYLLVNRKFGIQLNAGLSSDFFLQNTITPQSGSLDKTTQGSGENSPYRTINFSGLMGTEFTYRLGQRYRIALNPGVRYPLNSVYKSDVGVQSTPVTFDVGLRFRYIFQ